MNRKIKLAMAALLGFSAACSSVRNSSDGKSGAQRSVGVEAQSDTLERVVLMYGVPSPRFRQPDDGTPAAVRGVDSLDVSSERIPGER